MPGHINWFYCIVLPTMYIEWDLSPFSTNHCPSTRLVEMRAHQHGPCWRVMETGHPSTWAVNSGSGNRALNSTHSLTHESLSLDGLMFCDWLYVCVCMMVVHIVSSVSKPSICWFYAKDVDGFGTKPTMSVYNITVCLDGLIGMAAVGGAAAVAIGSIIGLGIALTRKWTVVYKDYVQLVIRCQKPYEWMITLNTTRVCSYVCWHVYVY